MIRLIAFAGACIASILLALVRLAHADCWTDLQQMVAERNLQADELQQQQTECRLQVDKDHKGRNAVADYDDWLADMNKCDRIYTYAMSQQLILDALKGRIACVKQTTGAH